MKFRFSVRIQREVSGVTENDDLSLQLCESFTFFQLVVLVSTAYIFPAVLCSLVFQYQAAVSCKKELL